MWTKGTLGPCTICIGTAIIEDSLEVPPKIKSRNTLCFSNFPFGYIYPKKTKSLSQRDTHLQAHCSVIHNSQDIEKKPKQNPEQLMNEWICALHTRTHITYVYIL